MKKMRFMAAALAAAMLLTASAFAAGPVNSPDLTAAPVTATPVAAAQPYRLSDKVTVTEISADGKYMLVTTSEKTELRLNLSDKTVVVDTQTGLAAGMSSVKAGDVVYAYYSPATTMSIPPQTACEALVVNLTDAHVPAHLLTAEQVTVNKDGSVTILTENGGMLLTIPETASVTPYKTKNIVKNTDIKVGTRFFAWYDVAAMSMPAQAGTDRAVVLPDATYTLKVSGKTLDASSLPRAVYDVDGTVMVPLRLTAKALGYDVSWNGKAGQIIVEDQIQKAVLQSGSTTARFIGKLKVINLTRDESMGAAAVIYSGCTYVPASFFGYFLNDVTVDGSSVSIAPQTAQLD